MMWLSTGRRPKASAALISPYFACYAEGAGRQMRSAMATGRPPSMAMIAMTLSLRRRALSLGLLAGGLTRALAAAAPRAAPRPGEPVRPPAPNAVVMEGDGGSVLFEKNADVLIPPASLSKMMTAEVLFNELKQGRRKPSEE